MGYKKAPSIKHQNSKIKASVNKLFSQGKVESFLDSLPPEARRQFDESLREQVNNHISKTEE